MRAQDIIRAVLDLLDKSEEPSGSVEVTTDMPPEEGEPIASRFKQIFAMLNNPSETIRHAGLLLLWILF